MMKYKANYDFTNENIVINFGDWDMNRYFLGSFIVKYINIPNQDVAFEECKGEFTVFGVWNKNKTWYGLNAEINILANKADVKELAKKIQENVLKWDDIEKMMFINWRVNSEQYL